MNIYRVSNRTKGPEVNVLTFTAWRFGSTADEVITQDVEIVMRSEEDTPWTEISDLALELVYLWYERDDARRHAIDFCATYWQDIVEV